MTWSASQRALEMERLLKVLLGAGFLMGKGRGGLRPRQQALRTEWVGCKGQKATPGQNRKGSRAHPPLSTHLTRETEHVTLGGSSWQPSGNLNYHWASHLRKQTKSKQHSRCVLTLMMSSPPATSFDLNSSTSFSNSKQLWKNKKKILVQKWRRNY